jgi:hypothetical protein
MNIDKLTAMLELEQVVKIKRKESAPRINEFFKIIPVICITDTHFIFLSPSGMGRSEEWLLEELENYYIIKD